jgi:hypothetical protein
MERCLTVSSATPFQIGIAAQRAKAAARRIDQHAVDLARQPPHALVVLGIKHLRVHVRQLRAAQSRRQVGQPSFRYVEGIQATGRLHHGAQQQRLAAGAGAEVDHHFAALRCEQITQQLAAFVLHFDCA